jgi:hypothetical protein
MNEIVERTEVLVPGPAEGLSALLGVPLPDFTAGDGLPLLWHWLYLLDRPAQRDVGRDGHPAAGRSPRPRSRADGGYGPAAGLRHSTCCAAASRPQAAPRSFHADQAGPIGDADVPSTSATRSPNRDAW